MKVGVGGEVYEYSMWVNEGRGAAEARLSRDLLRLPLSLSLIFSVLCV